MPSPLHSRRTLLKGATTLFASAAVSPFALGALSAELEGLLISAVRRADGQFALLIFTAQGKVVREILLNGRGHDVAFHARTGNVVSFARRPGRFALSFNARDNRAPTLFVPPANRHFYGHGAFSKDGFLLFASENDFDTARGVIGIYDVRADFNRVGEIPSHGVGPHEILLMNDGRTLVVANGGIETHPLSGREKLNVETMAPSLCFVDSATGDLKVRHTLSRELHKLSIRHLACDNSGHVWFGGQWQGARENTPGLIGMASMDQPLTLCEAVSSLGAELKGYIGSVAVSENGAWVGASAPRAGRIIYVDTSDVTNHRLQELTDGCGLAPLAKDTFAISSGGGKLVRDSAGGSKRTNLASLAGTSFDNHMRRIG